MYAVPNACLMRLEICAVEAWCSLPQLIKSLCSAYLANSQQRQGERMETVSCVGADTSVSHILTLACNTGAASCQIRQPVALGASSKYCIPQAPV